jgi:hypothetical protein
MDKRAQLVGAKANYSKKMDVMKNIIALLSYFTTHEWIFQSDNVVSLNEKMNLGTLFRYYRYLLVGVCLFLFLYFYCLYQHPILRFDAYC